MNLTTATTEELLSEQRKYDKKYKDVDEQLQSIHDYLCCIDIELRTRERKKDRGIKNG